MRISFDIDDVLVLHSNAPSQNERALVPWLDKCYEPLRLGSVRLIKELRQNGHEVWIYTSSQRGLVYIKMWLCLYGIRVDGIINQKVHLANTKHLNFLRLPSKYPPTFGIDLHIDDSLGVVQEGERYGFNVLRTDPIDENWVQTILKHLSISQVTL